MDYRERLSCRRKKCAGELTVPIKLVIKGDRLVDVARCPRCRESYKFILPMVDKDQWLPLVARPFFQCDVCGTPNEDNWRIPDRDYVIWHALRIKTVTLCRNCGKKRAKVVSKPLWNDIAASIGKAPEGKAPEAAPTTLACPHCGAQVAESVKICPKCNKEIFCSKCDALIAPGAVFCRSCGEKVEVVTAPISAGPPKEKICPTCQESYEEGSIFCSVCGQELACDKCGASIRESALFCTNCGDAVTKGELSE